MTIEMQRLTAAMRREDPPRAEKRVRVRVHLEGNHPVSLLGFGGDLLRGTVAEATIYESDLENIRRNKLRTPEDVARLQLAQEMHEGVVAKYVKESDPSLHDVKDEEIRNPASVQDIDRKRAIQRALATCSSSVETEFFKVNKARYGVRPVLSIEVLEVDIPSPMDAEAAKARAADDERLAMMAAAIAQGVGAANKELVRELAEAKKQKGG